MGFEGLPAAQVVASGAEQRHGQGFFLEDFGGGLCHAVRSREKV
jgi:hypothetical protein